MMCTFRGGDLGRGRGGGSFFKAEVNIFDRVTKKERQQLSNTAETDINWISKYHANHPIHSTHFEELCVQIIVSLPYSIPLYI